MNITLTPVRFLERARTLFGSRIAVVCEGRRYTYSAFAERVNRLANALTKWSMSPGDKVAFLGYNSHQLLECYYGIVQIGAILLPLNIRLISQAFDYICNDASPKILFLHPDFVPKIDPIVHKIPSVKEYYLLEPMENPPKWAAGLYEDFLQRGGAESPFSSLNYPFHEDDTAELFYTSGTTGPPKGVMLSHRNLYLHALAEPATMAVAETDVQLHLIPLFHVNGWGTPHYLTAKGGAHVMVKKFDPATVLRLIQQERVTRFFIVPTMVTALLEFPDLASYDLSTVKDVLIGGAPPPTGMCARLSEVFGCVVHGGFGMSETCPVIALPELSLDLDPEVFRHRAHETWGFPLVGVEFKVVDTEGNELPWDGKAVGELLVRGDMVMTGYLNKPEATERALKDGWYHTGDLVSMGPDGSLFIRDRMKDIIISGGENISSLEIEQVLYANPEVLECAVIAKKDPKWGEIPKALVVLQPGSTLTAEDIVKFTKERMAHFKALREAEIVETLPKGGTGKILKSELRKMYG
ncbi:MAG: long-chain-fatty-acid--CoA ligase [Desulfomonile sp.]|nr:long-chain-fatty-acid--CoA ligase [Desulfomonile sp.]